MLQFSWSRLMALVCAVMAILGLGLWANTALAAAQTSEHATFPRSKADLLRVEGPTGPARQEAANKIRTDNSVKDAPSGCSGWSSVPVGELGPGWNGFNDIDGVSPNDIWAVGFRCAECGTADEYGQTLIEHWDGTSWSVVPSPNTGPVEQTLYSVLPLSEKNAWATGIYLDGTRFATLTVHWGGSEWSIVPSPNPGPRNNYLNALDAVGPNDIWAVGTYRDGPLRTLIEHWDGTNWTVVPSPNVGTARNLLVDIEAFSADNIWALGQACNDTICSDGRIMLLHWDGSEWTVASAPDPTPYGEQAQEISATRPNDIWIGGTVCLTPFCIDSVPMVLHWDGATWSDVSNPLPAGSVSAVNWGIVAIRARDVWVSGSARRADETFFNLLAHWDGSTWTNVTVDSPGTYDNNLWAITAFSPNNVWAAGDYSDGEGYQLVTQHYKGPCY
jgi:hypothetical protein